VRSQSDYIVAKYLTDALSAVNRHEFGVAEHLISELLAIKRSWVDLPEELIYVNGRVTKNRASKIAPIYGQMKPWLEKLLSQGEEESPKCVWLFRETVNRSRVSERIGRGLVKQPGYPVCSSMICVERRFAT